MQKENADPAAQRAAQLEAARHTIGEKVEQITAAKASAPFTLRNAPALSPLLRGKAAPIGERVDALAESLLGQPPPSHNASKRSIVKLKGAVRSVGQTARQRLKRTVSIPGATGVSEDKRAANLASAMQDFASSEGMDNTPESASGEEGRKTLSPSGLASTRKLRIAAMVVERLSQTHKDVHRRSIEKLRRKRSKKARFNATTVTSSSENEDSGRKGDGGTKYGINTMTKEKISEWSGVEAESTSKI